MELPRNNLNAASEHELTHLPRIGVDKACRILRYRTIREWSDR